MDAGVVVFDLCEDAREVEAYPPAKRLRWDAIAEASALPRSAAGSSSFARGTSSPFVSQRDDTSDSVARASSDPSVTSSACDKASFNTSLSALFRMGSAEDVAASALRVVGGNLESAASASAEGSILSAAVENHHENRSEEVHDICEPILLEGVDARTCQSRQVLLEMGFSEDDSIAALVASDGDIEAAIDALSGPSSLRDGTNLRGSRDASTKRGRQKAQVTPHQTTEVSQRAERQKSRLTILSEQAKGAVVAALAGPNLKGSGRVARSIRRGRVALQPNLWAGSDDDAKLAEASKAYGRLKEYQRVAVRWLLALDDFGIGGILADEMGLGKTAVTITFLDLLATRRAERGERTITPSLVVVPKTLLDAWEVEILNWCPQLRPFRFYSENAVGRLALVEEYFERHHGSCGIVITTPTVLHNKVERLTFLKKLSFEYIVLDEAHSLKNADSGRFRDVQGMIQAKQRLLLTGTPVQNSLKELGNLLSLLLVSSSRCRGETPKSLQRDDMIRAASAELSDLVETGSLRTLQVRAAPMILRRLKKDVMAELPTKTGHIVRCKLIAPQRLLYDQELETARIKATASSSAGSGRGRATTKAAAPISFVKDLFHRLRRICNHTLMAQGRFSDADYERVVGLLCEARQDFRRSTPQRCLAEVRTWSDFELLQCLREYGLLQKIGPVDRERFSLSDEDLKTGSSKVQELLRLLGERRKMGSKTLVFSQYTRYLDLIEVALSRCAFKYVRLDGQTQTDDRSTLVKAFQAKGSELDVFLLSTKAGGVGLNLTSANCVVMMDLSFNPQDNRQAEDRVHRLGQTQPVTIYYLICEGTLEESILRANSRKMTLDYQFGGQRFLLNDSASSDAGQMRSVDGSISGIDDALGSDEEEEACDVASVEREALAELQRLCMSTGPAAG